MTINEYATKHGCTGQTVRRWIKQGRVTATARGRTWDVADEPPRWADMERAASTFAQLVRELASAGCLDTARKMAEDLVKQVEEAINGSR